MRSDPDRPLPKEETEAFNRGEKNGGTGDMRRVEDCSPDKSPLDSVRERLFLIRS